MPFLPLTASLHRFDKDVSDGGGGNGLEAGAFRSLHPLQLGGFWEWKSNLSGWDEAGKDPGKGIAGKPPQGFEANNGPEEEESLMRERTKLSFNSELTKMEIQEG